MSEALGRGDRAYDVQPSPAGLRLSNRGQRLEAFFGEAGPRVRSGGGRFGLSLRSVGHGDTLRPLGHVAPRSRGNRVAYRHGALTEWYANGPLGLQQGFTLDSRPRGPSSGPLTLALDLTGNLSASVLPGRRGLKLVGAGTSLRYTGLVTSDARGRELRSWLELRGERLLVRVDDARARYPLTVDPFVQQSKLTTSDGAGGDWLGFAVGVSGDTIAVGANLDDVVAGDQGSVYVFSKPPGGWANATEVARLIASDGAAGDQLGYSVGISGNTIVAGADKDRVGANSLQGSTYVFVRPPGGWTNATQTAKLTASDGAASDRLGYTAAISGDTVVAGAYLDDVGNNANQGSAYVFVKPNGGWTNATETGRLTASDGAAGDLSGLGVATSGDTIVSAAPDADVDGRVNQGAAYLFVRPSTGWANMTETAKLTASDGAEYDGMGAWGVAASGDTLAVGARLADIGSNPDQGSVYVYVRPSSGWVTTTETAKLTASDGQANDALGLGVGISGDTVVAGSRKDDVGERVDQGSLYVFDKPSGGWANMTETAKLIASDGASGDVFSWGLAISGNTVVAGAYLHDRAAVDEGAAYVYVRTQCSDGLDNDGDGEVDFGSGASNDPGCVSAADDSESTDANPQCSDELDNDGDGEVDDPADAGCTAPGDDSEDSESNPQCSDEVDNDGDGEVDFGSGASNDPGCLSAADDSESTDANPQCSDELDNDGDGQVDAPDDPGCVSAADDSESTDANPQCSDELDNDGDGEIDDPADAGCTAPGDDSEDSESNPQCSDEVDNDGDGQVDAPDDPGCVSAADDSESTDANPQCSDELDNDGDGQVDAPDDPGCVSAADDSESTDANPQCSDELDNDGDGEIDDPADAGCTAPGDDSESSESNPQCSDEVDNDGDGQTDHPGDPGCMSAADDSEFPDPLLACSDLQDNDGDGKIDFGGGPDNDPGCTSAADNTEATDANPQCSDELDNDGDGQVDDPADAGCTAPGDDSESSESNPQCSDEVDNDGDGQTDHPDDPGCVSAADDSESTDSNPQCSDELDNDGDGLTDHPDDPSCTGPEADDEAERCGGDPATVPGATEGNDVLTGTNGPDVIVGLGGDDVISGLDGDDKLCGGDGNDTLAGGPGGDRLSGQGDSGLDASADLADYSGAAGPGVNVDLAAGQATGEGTDTLTGISNVTGSEFDDTLRGEDGDNTLTGEAGDDTLDGGAGADTLSGLGGVDTVSYAARTTAVTVGIDGVADDGGAEDGPAAARDNVQADVENLTGGSAADTLTGDSAGNALVGGDGGDTLDGGAGADSLSGLGGVDTVSYAARTTAVTVDIDGVADDGGAEDGPAAARDNVQANVENVTGGGGPDTLTGDTGPNTLTGAEGDDTLDGDKGPDTLLGLGGVDTVTYANRAIAVTADIDGVADDGNISDQSGTLRDNVQTDVENLIGSALPDTLTGSPSGNALTGGNGDDTLDGGGGADTLSGQGGVDTVSYAARTTAVTVDIDGMADDGSAEDGPAAARDNVQPDVENLAGGSGGDTLIGGNATNNNLDGGAGADSLSGLGGVDTVSYAARTTAVTVDIDGVADDGGAEDGPAAARDNVQTDVENLTGGSAADTLAGGAANNTLDGRTGADSLSGLGGVDTVSYAARTTAVTVDIDGVADDGGAEDGPAAARDNVQTDVENLTGGSAADTLAGGAANNTLDGGGGADTLSGLGGIDTVSYAGRAFAVTVDIDGAADDGSSSDQTGSLRDNVQTDVENLIGSSLADTLAGGAANNVLDGGAGADSLSGLGGVDAVSYAARTTAVTVDIDGVADDGGAEDGPAAARDNVQGDIEDLVGGPAADTLIGGSGNNTLDGGGGADTLSGLGGIDTVTYATRGIAVAVDIDGVADDGSSSDQSGSLRDNVQTDVENLIGSSLADSLVGGAADNVLDGGGGADTLSGLGGIDTATYATRTIAVTVDIDGVADDGSASDQTGTLRDDVRGGRGEPDRKPAGRLARRRRRQQRAGWRERGGHAEWSGRRRHGHLCHAHRGRDGRYRRRGR